jgi:hypothetical protein
MKTNLKSLTPWFRTLDQEFETLRIIERKQRVFFKWIENILPSNIKGQYSFDSLDKDATRCFIYLDPKDENSMINLINWLKELKGKRLIVEKFWRKEDGYFAYKVERKYKYYINYTLFFEQGANIDGCKIIKKEETKTIFVTDCENNRILIE